MQSLASVGYRAHRLVPSPPCWERFSCRNCRRHHDELHHLVHTIRLGPYRTQREDFATRLLGRFDQSFAVRRCCRCRQSAACQTLPFHQRTLRRVLRKSLCRRIVLETHLEWQTVCYQHTLRPLKRKLVRFAASLCEWNQKRHRYKQRMNSLLWERFRCCRLDKTVLVYGT